MKKCRSLLCLFLCFSLLGTGARADDQVVEEERVVEVLELVFTTFSRFMRLFSDPEPLLAADGPELLNRLLPPLDGQLVTGHETYWFRSGLARYYAWRETISRGWLGEEKALAFFAEQISLYLGDERAGKLPLDQAGLFKYARRDLLESGGFLTVLALDLKLRQGGETSLDELVEKLYADGGQYSATDVRQLAQSLTDTDLEPFFSRYVHGTDFLPLGEILTETGLVADWDPVTVEVQLHRLPEEKDRPLLDALIRTE